MKNLFRPKDFEALLYEYSLTQDHVLAASIANKKLNSLIESWPMVYDGDAGISCFKEDTWGYVKYDENNHSMISSNFRNSKRKARLAFVEPIVKEPCKHQGTKNYKSGGDENRFICKHCGVELQATWSEKK